MIRRRALKGAVQSGHNHSSAVCLLEYCIQSQKIQKHDHVLHQCLPFCWSHSVLHQLWPHWFQPNQWIGLGDYSFTVTHTASWSANITVLTVMLHDGCWMQTTPSWDNNSPYPYQKEKKTQPNKKTPPKTWHPTKLKKIIKPDLFLFAFH